MKVLDKITDRLESRIIAKFDEFMSDEKLDEMVEKLLLFGGRLLQILLDRSVEKFLTNQSATQSES